MSKLFISKRYYDKFLEQEAKQMIKVYGFPDRDDYFNEIIKFLNELYSFLEIDGIDIMDTLKAHLMIMMKLLYHSLIHVLKKEILSFLNK